MGLTKATIKNLDTGDIIACLFNPTEFTVTKSNPWQSKPVVGKDVPSLEFTGGGARELSMELFLDVSNSSHADVGTDVKKLFALTLITEKQYNIKSKKSRPPRCQFVWGSNETFTAVVMNLETRYTLFRPNGTAVRATCKIKFQESEDDNVPKGQNPTSFSPGGRKRREVRPHDTLALISFEEYGDSTHWRKIALENEIDDPASLRPGQILAIPPRS